MSDNEHKPRFAGMNVNLDSKVPLGSLTLKVDGGKIIGAGMVYDANLIVGRDKVMRPTMNLRFSKLGVLQQMWQDDEARNPEWRDIPTEQ